MLIYLILVLLSVLYADSYSVFRLCPKDEWLFIKYPRKNRELILAPILLAERQRETASESESGREKESERESKRKREKKERRRKGVTGVKKQNILQLLIL